VWSPDGGRIAFSRTRELGPDSDGREDIDVMESRVGATVRTVVRPYAPNRQSLAWLADGAGIVFVQGVEPKYNQYIQDQLALVPLPRGAPRPMATALDRAIKSYALSVDSRSITAIVEDDGSAYPAQIDLATGKVTRRVEGQFVASALSEAGGHAALISSTDVSAPEVYALEASALRKLTSHNDALFDGLRLGEVHDVRFPGKDGADIHGMLVLPPAYVLGRRYPTILWIHGGPNGQDAHALTLKSDQFLRQLLAAQGFVVLGVNYRGSSGRGNTFAQSIVADWGHREVQDVLDGVDHLIARGIADPARLAIGGWSYGAILTNYTIAGDHRFKAAFSGAGSADMSGMYGSDEYILQYSNELGAPWRNTALWLKLSYPFLHADKIRTPTLFMGGDKDFDVPLAGGEQMYQALRTLGVPTQLVVYPGESHVFSRPSYLKDRAERMVTWFNRFLAPKQ
jgi:dipeptidyl aminopeptidase/acylaminoacyl peptidase